MPIQLRWEGGLGGGVHAIQIIASWAQQDGVRLILRLPPAFSSQENTRDRFASTLPGNLTLERFRRITQEHVLNPKLRDVFLDLLNAVERAENPLIRDIFNRTNAVIEKAVVTNLGGVYVLPLALLLSLTRKLHGP